MDLEIERTRALYARAWPGIRLLSPADRRAIAAAADLYRAILGKIVRNGYDVFHYRAHPTTAKKLIRIPRLWWSLRRKRVGR